MQRQPESQPQSQSSKSHSHSHSLYLAQSQVSSSSPCTSPLAPFFNSNRTANANASVNSSSSYNATFGQPTFKFASSPSSGSAKSQKQTARRNANLEEARRQERERYDRRKDAIQASRRAARAARTPEQIAADALKQRQQVAALKARKKAATPAATNVNANAKVTGRRSATAAPISRASTSASHLATTIVDDDLNSRDCMEYRGDNYACSRHGGDGEGDRGEDPAAARRAYQAKWKREKRARQKRERERERERQSTQVSCEAEPSASAPAPAPESPLHFPSVSKKHSISAKATNKGSKPESDVESDAGSETFLMSPERDLDLELQIEHEHELVDGNTDAGIGIDADSLIARRRRSLAPAPDDRAYASSSRVPVPHAEAGWRSLGLFDVVERGDADSYTGSSR